MAYCGNSKDTKPIFWVSCFCCRYSAQLLGRIYLFPSLSAIFHHLNSDNLINSLTNSLINSTNQSNQIKKDNGNTSNNYNYKLDSNSLITDKKKMLISNPDYETWLEEQISLLSSRFNTKEKTISLNDARGQQTNHRLKITKCFFSLSSSIIKPCFLACSSISTLL